MDMQAMETLREALLGIVSKRDLIADAPMSQYTSLKLGGPAQLLCEIASPEKLGRVLAAAYAQGAPVTLLGNGSNLLVRDGGVRGLVVHIGEGMSEVSAPVPLPDGRFAITAQAGATLQKLSNAAANHGLRGLEFASGIPGSVGGAAYMNAGAYGGEMKDVVTGVTAFDPTGKPLHLSAEQMEFGYRHSRFCDLAQPEAIATVTVTLEEGDEETIRATMREFNARRREKQPLTLPSCGSTFKRPEGQFAGTLIEQCGLKGLRVGGASVSELHAGFLVNDQEGTAADYLALIARVQKAVWEQKGVQLNPEVRILGEEFPVQAL